MKITRSSPSTKFLVILSVLLTACSQSPATPTSQLETSTPANVAPTATDAPAQTPAYQLTETLAPTIVPSPIVSSQDKAHYVSETYPDGSNVALGAAFQKSWKLQNSGTTTWTTDYKLVFVSSSSPNERLGSPDTVSLSKAVKPGEIIDISLPLTAPQTLGQYKVTWRLLNPQGQSVSVDGYDLWALVNVGNVQANASSNNTAGGNVQQSVTASGIKIDLTNLTYDKPLDIWSTNGLADSPDPFYKASGVTVEYCIAFPDLTGWSPQEIAITVNGQSVNGDFRYKNLKSDPIIFTNSYRCFISAFTNKIQPGESFSFSIGLIGKDGLLDGDCPAAQQILAAQYPDLKFTCLPISARAGFYTLVQRPKGMNDQKADRIIMDAIQQNIYGPWTFNITR